ncbi:S8 family serine peptidase [Candidatus Fermentibacteria bacterium]|nr:S8 family serine peptidase [Candidatus Fermentibacteria bacterium]
MRRVFVVTALALIVSANMVAAATMSVEAARKVDPKLLMLHKDPATFGKGFTNAALGAAVDPKNAVVPVIVKTTAPRSRLEAAGATVGSVLGDIVTARIPLEKLEAIALLEDVEAIEASYRLYNCMDVSVPECGGTAVRQQLGFTGNGVIVGLLDTGIDPYHPDFLDANNKTRVQFIWDQWSSGTPPSGYTYGREWTKAQIDAGNCTMNDPGAHGSHCSGTAAGDGSASNAGYIGMATKADIMMVSNLSDDIFSYGYAPPWSPTPSTMGSLDGLAYLYQKKSQLNKPMVISWSQGVTMGPHDGSTLFEQGVDNFITTRNIPVCIAAGNDQEQDWHARAQVTTGSARTVSFTTGTPGQDQLSGDVKFEIWYKLGDKLNLEIIDPFGGVSSVFGPDETGWPGWIMSTGDTVWVYSTSNHPVSHKGYFLVDLWDWNDGVTQGTWRIRLSADNSLPQGGQFDAWFERNQYAVHWLENVSLESIVGMPGSAKQAITVGSYNTKLQWYDIDGTGWTISETMGEISGFSSNGPTADGRQKPNLSAPGQIIASVMSSGSAPDYTQNQRYYVAPDGVHVYMQGTSMATPHVAGCIATMLEKKPTASYTEIRDILQNTARHDQYTGQGWQKDFGWGKLDAYAAVQATGGGGPGQTVELIYDDGTPTSGYYWPGAGQGSGVQMTPPQYPATIKKLKYYINSVSGGASFSARTYDTVTGNQITNALTVTAPGTGWLEVDVSGQNKQVTAEFIVCMFYDGVNTPTFGYDPADNGRAWDFDGTNWDTWNETYFMRTIVQVGSAVEDEIELAGLSANAVEGAVMLAWSPSVAWEISGYNVYRNKSAQTESWNQVNRAMLTETSFKDETVEPGQTYFYWLEAVTPSGVGTLFGPVDVTTLGGPTTLWLMQPRPTPTNGPSSLRFFLPTAGTVSMGLYDVAGRRVASMMEPEEMGSGWRSLSWAPTTSLPSGRYVCRLALDAGDLQLSATKPFILIR